MESTTKKTVGLIGLGLLGSAIGYRLMRAGFTVWGHDISPPAMSRFSVRGGQPIVRIGDVPMAANPVVLSLPTSDVVEDVLVTIIPRLKAGTILIDTTTGDPERTRVVAERVAEAGIMLVDAAVLGSSTVTRDGNAELLVGGAPLTVKECRFVLEAISIHIHHVGQVGAGQQMKLVIDLVNGLHQAALAEGLHLAKKTSVDPYRLLEILDPGTAYSKGLGAKGLRMIEEDFEPQIRLSQQLKATQLILDVAKGVETELPLSETYRTLLQTADAQGNGHLDDSAIIQAWNTVRSSTDQRPKV